MVRYLYRGPLRSNSLFCLDAAEYALRNNGQSRYVADQSNVIEGKSGLLGKEIASTAKYHSPREGISETDEFIAFAWADGVAGMDDGLEGGVTPKRISRETPGSLRKRDVAGVGNVLTQQ
jgi:hypothetical protein